MKGNETRFYVYQAGMALGPLNFEQIQAYDEEALVMKEGEDAYWPRRRWLANGERCVTQYEHYQAWVWLLAFAPALAWLLKPELLRMEFGIGWMIALTIAFIGMKMCRRDFPRFPED